MRKLLLKAGLLALCAVPVVAGVVRLQQVIGNIDSGENARFLASPWPIGLHVVSVSVFCIMGVFQIAPGLRPQRDQWHRMAGRVLVPFGLMASLSGIWMTQFYPKVGFDGTALYWIRLLVGILMFLFLVFGVLAILRRDFFAHLAWMIRAYALGMGAGTQVLTHIPFFLFPTIQSEFSRTLCMTAGWGLNIIVAELVIWRSRFSKLDPRPLSIAPT